MTVQSPHKVASTASEVLRAARATVKSAPVWGFEAAVAVNKILGAHDAAVRKTLDIARHGCSGRSGSRAYTLRWFDRAIALADKDTQP